MPEKLPKSQIQGIYNRIRAVLIEALGEVTDVRIAGIFKIKPQSVQQWKDGKSAPSRDSLNKFAADYRVSYDWLLTGKGEAVQGGSDDIDVVYRLYKMLDDDTRESVRTSLEMMRLYFDHIIKSGKAHPDTGKKIHDTKSLSWYKSRLLLLHDLKKEFDSASEIDLIDSLIRLVEENSPAQDRKKNSG